MWLRLALNLAVLSFLSACSPSDKVAVDKLNSLSYDWHYRNIDSAEVYARQAYARALHDADGRAEALNNLAFVSMVRMDYDQASRQLAEVGRLTDNQVELLVAEVGFMRLCQRRSQNREFYEHREQAEGHLKRIREERQALPERMQQRMIYAESEMAIVNSTYYYYVGLEQQSVEALQHFDTEAVRRDTAQYLNYLYNIGAGGFLSGDSLEQVRHDEVLILNRCLSIAQRHRYPYFEAQACEALADHTGDMQQAEQALRLFHQYGDVYQIAGAYRTLASCCHAMGDNGQALEYLQLALSDRRIHQAPDLVASIREQLSVAYAAVNDKQRSDENRRRYIELQEQTRQDRELEARAGILARAVSQLNWMIAAVLAAIVLLVLVLRFFNHRQQKYNEYHELDDLLEQRHEEVTEARLRVRQQERRHLELRAKVSLAVSILPLIDRILYAVGHLTPSDQSQTDYIRELTDNINEQNDLLTRWIQLRQGELSLHVESFGLQTLFDLVARSKTSFQMKGITLSVHPTQAVVKADRVLTLFMMNTLADNARKFTSRGGHVDIDAVETDDYVEVSVRDTGCGMTAEQQAHAFDHKIVHGHGYGLMNCQGIVEKYRKVSRIFSVCLLAVESEQGRGSRFFFRLPKGRLLTLVATLLLSWQLSVAGGRTSSASTSMTTRPLEQAHAFADSTYVSNAHGHYERTLAYTDSCLYYLNRHYLLQQPQGRLLAQRSGDNGPIAEIQWLHDSIDTDYQIVLEVRNECAVAALSLHQWSLYTYNNKVYTQLFKELSADNTLADYCRTMQQSQQNKHIAVVLLLILLALIVPAYYLLYFRQRLNIRFRRERQQVSDIEQAEDELRRAELESSNLHVVNSVLDNCLSTLKHETMYYPSRIRQLVDSHHLESLAEVAGYYRDLYGMLIGQAVSQMERIKLHIRPVTLYGQTVLGDEHLLQYLFELVSGARESVRTEVKDDKYVVYHIPLTAHLPPLTSLLARQIVRDHGEATNRRGCGISIDHETLTIILPRPYGTL